MGGNPFGVLGNGSTNAGQNYVTQIPGLSGIIGISNGGLHCLFLKKDGRVWACGYNGFGEIGDGTSIDRPAPAQTINLTGVTAISAGATYSLALRNDSTVWAWGINTVGQIGDGSFNNRLSPVNVIGLNGIVAISAGSSSSLALKRDGTVWSWGSNSGGELGNGVLSVGGCQCDSIASQIPGLSGVIAIATNAGHSFALKNDGTLWGWGYNFQDMLNVGDSLPKSSPTQIIGMCSPLGVNEMKVENEEVNVYPNPTLSAFTITSTEKIKEIKVFNVLGEEILGSGQNDKAATMDISKEATGIYFVEVKTENSTDGRTSGIVRKKIIKE